MANSLGTLRDTCTSANLRVPVHFHDDCPADFRVTAGTSTSVDPDLERNPPAPATVVYFPENDIKFKSADNWFSRPNGPPDLYTAYCHIAKPSDVRLPHLSDLNIAVETDVSPEALMPPSCDGLQHLPPKSWGAHSSDPKAKDSSTYEVYAHSSYPLLSNGTKAPELEMFQKFVSELNCETDAGLRMIGKQKPKPGQRLPSFNHFRRFWAQLELMASYWYAGDDHYFEVDAHEKSSTKLRNKLSSSRRSSVDHTAGVKILRYKGRRTSTGTKMPDHYRTDIVKAFLEPLVFAFGCNMANPRRIPQLQVKSLLIPVTQTAVIWRVPQDKGQSKRGVLEGPVMGIQCRSETGFVKDPSAALLDAAREMAGLLLLGQERAREGKVDLVPGLGKWYTSKPRWGGGPGGEFGELEGNKETGSHAHGRRHSIAATQIRLRPSEEDIWKELKSGPGLFEARMTYLAVGKERHADNDAVFMISSLYHHIAILKLDIHPLYLEYLSTGIVPSEQPNSRWYAPTIQRTRWFDLFVPDDRADAMRCIWGVLSYSMRTGMQSEPLGQRQKSEISHAFPFRKKKYEVHTDPNAPARSHSVAF